MDRDKATLKTQIDTLDRQIANTEEQIELRNEADQQLAGADRAEGSGACGGPAGKKTSSTKNSRPVCG